VGWLDLVALGYVRLSWPCACAVGKCLWSRHNSTSYIHVNIILVLSIVEGKVIRICSIFLWHNVHQLFH
jgi:hypothetical protein